MGRGYGRGRNQCPDCGRTWPFDGSWQRDNRCFCCGWVDSGALAAAHDRAVNAAAARPPPPPPPRYVCSACRHAESRPVEGKEGGPDLGLIGFGLLLVPVGVALVALGGVLAVVAGIGMILSGLTGTSVQRCSQCKTLWNSVPESSPASGSSDGEVASHALPK